MSIAFVDLVTGIIHSVYTFQPDIGVFSKHEPVTPDGCVRIEIHASIVCIDAIKTISITEPPYFEIVNDEDKLAILRIQNLPYIRETRNQLLAMCDWRVLPDSPITNEQRIEWVAYRQALRDFPEKGDVINQVWPTMP